MSDTKFNEDHSTIFVTHEPNGFWQLCPKCNGDGNLLRYNTPNIMGTNANPICDLCNGKKIISIITGLPPN